MKEDKKCHLPMVFLWIMTHFFQQAFSLLYRQKSQASCGLHGKWCVFKFWWRYHLLSSFQEFCYLLCSLKDAIIKIYNKIQNKLEAPSLIQGSHPQKKVVINSYNLHVMLAKIKKIWFTSLKKLQDIHNYIAFWLCICSDPILWHDRHFSHEQHKCFACISDFLGD